MDEFEYRKRKLILLMKQKQLQIEERQLEMDALEYNMRNAKSNLDREILQCEYDMRIQIIKRLELEKQSIKQQIAELVAKQAENEISDQINVDIKTEEVS